MSNFHVIFPKIVVNRLTSLYFSSFIFIFLGIDTVTYKVIPASKAEERMTQVRKEYGYEGEVMYFVDNKDHVIGLLKKKTAW